MSGLTGEPQPTDGEEIERLMIEMYETVSGRIRASVAMGKLTPDNFQVMLLKVVEVVEDFSQRLPAHISGVEKRDIAIQVTQRVIDDLHEHGHIDDEAYGWLKLSITFMAPALFSGLKALYKEVHGLVVDIADNGCNGCFGRNFGSKRK